MTTYKDATLEEVNSALLQSAEAFAHYKNLSLKDRSVFLYAIAEELKEESAIIIALAHRETHLAESRLQTELQRTIFQLTSYADACAEGTWLDIRIDTADVHRTPPKPDLRKMLIPLGPVVVFGASNFPFAYSTAGGDTACALAAGCTVIIKAHPAHAGTSEAVAEAIQKAAKKCGLPSTVFIHLHGAGFEVGKALVQHPLTKAVGFTGSFEGGKALFDIANAREVPIPVFAEMGSVNPVFILPERLNTEAEALTKQLANSITQSAGQFCTKPGILVGVKGENFTRFTEHLTNEINRVPSIKMLSENIAEKFHISRKVRYAEGAETITDNISSGPNESLPTLGKVSAEHFLATVSEIYPSMLGEEGADTTFYFELLHKEVFGPFSLIVECEHEEGLLKVALSLEGQLTTTLIATTQEAADNKTLIDILKEKCGRLIFNGVPTGVEVGLGMHHGGPYPATTDSRFTAVGADGIKRFARPICYQGWTNDLLPDELKDENPLGLWRTVNNALTKDPVTTN